MLTLMRHGQASFGAAHYDRLSPLGVAQARAAGSFVRMQGLQFDRVCIGPRERHRDTAQGFIDGWGRQPDCSDEVDLDEFADSSNLLASDRPVDASAPAPSDDAGGPVRADLQRLLRRIGAWADGDLVLHNGPTLHQFRQRVGRWARHQLKLGAHAAAGSTAPLTLAVTSAGVVAAAMCELLDLPDSQFLPLVSQVRNASFTEFMLWRERPVLVSFNGTPHLTRDLLSAI